MSEDKKPAEPKIEDDEEFLEELDKLGEIFGEEDHYP